MIKFSFSFFLLIGVLLNAGAQVPLQSIAEHFTNTKCGICANKNPGFYANLTAHPGILHLSIHPSSPYQTCILSQQNMAGNDVRTNFYGVYGSTPRVVINGNVLAGGTNYSGPNLFDPYLSLTSPFSIHIEQDKTNAAQVISKVVIKAESTHNLTEALLFVGLVEDTVFVNGGNGELKHYNVLRHAATEPEGLALGLPQLPGDSVVMIFTSASGSVWNYSRIYSLAILQHTNTKAVLQSAKTSVAAGGTVAASEPSREIQLTVFPNPTGDLLQLQSNEPGVLNFEIYDAAGALLQKGDFVESIKISTAAMPAGTGIIKVFNEDKYCIKQVIIH